MTAEMREELALLAHAWLQFGTVDREEFRPARERAKRRAARVEYVGETGRYYEMADAVAELLEKARKQ